MSKGALKDKTDTRTAARIIPDGEYSLRREEIPVDEQPVVGKIAVKPQKFLRMLGISDKSIVEKVAPVDGRVQKLSEVPFVRWVIMILSAALMLYAILPIFVGVFTVGTLPPLLIGAFFFAVARYWNCIVACNKWWFNALCAVVAVIVGAGILLMCFISGLMLGASMKTVPEYKSRTTVIVLGCKIHGDQPSRMLKDRLDVAYDYLAAHPQAHCIVTGGQGDDEDYAEAEIMQRYLIERGISAERIIAETQSTSTRENLENAAALLEQYNCHKETVVVSDRFHQYRAQLIAKDVGLDPFALNVETRWYLAMHYWFREMAGIARIALIGY
ncbi:MAG: YdcF family protein [Clostridia bacterium]|nr:YdcF family protein [Clostridia bacterium]